MGLSLSVEEVVNVPIPIQRKTCIIGSFRLFNRLSVQLYLWALRVSEFVVIVDLLYLSG